MLFILKTNIQIAIFSGWLIFLSYSSGLAVQDEAHDIRAKIQTQKKMVNTFSQKEVDILDGLNKIDQELNKTHIKALAMLQDVKLREKKIWQLGRDKDQLLKKIGLTEKYTEKRLIALYKMNMIGKLDVAGRPSSVFDFFVQQNSMKRIIYSDFKILENQTSDLEKFETLEQKLKKEIQAKIILEETLNAQIRHNKKEAKKKEALLTDIRKKKKLSLAMVDSLTRAAQKLDKKVNHIQKDKRSPPGNDSFSNYQGRLMIPVPGKIISKFGLLRTGDYNSFTFRKGIDIKVKKGEPVKSVFKGKILFAHWLKGYGNLMVIDHGGNYYTLYAHVEEIFKQKGEIVKTGEIIATAGDTGSIKGSCLHFEIRHHGKAVNPMKWLKKGA
ncbi:MAG: peptidoglycan DD-metalloendopeptidase family protein [Desulfobacula sp.]|jgi:murein hydrolase activator|uniref:murein hydrolase activator EnvC family protein n=2 Tax=Desulfobacula sp. TaxID=2593537 RepID=UPI001DAF2C61|nr:peptidoglycan DD-metalloendopeptidase family protein [Desulfobacula sp.]MBT3484874.1 peptidoglycan DD-metalloendopeptidase family protein [Desulfobacula sp.]MBT3804656.1 peptidoglycan DD-metalloendopeptidase family protein [Desulfobacula sp.]MBT4024006.1 peptidoglycan DD-metalloendopeptidase family protein [Desulfobacula sp.]MBT4198368.1 peptidoglycan DD-metalloendopeptidase family protein [Desulfobacula sp.]